MPMLLIMDRQFFSINVDCSVDLDVNNNYIVVIHIDVNITFGINQYGSCCASLVFLGNKVLNNYP